MFEWVGLLNDFECIMVEIGCFYCVCEKEIFLYTISKHYLVYPFRTEDSVSQCRFQNLRLVMGGGGFFLVFILSFHFFHSRYAAIPMLSLKR